MQESGITPEMLNNWFSYHKTFGDQLERYKLVRDIGCKSVAAAFIKGDKESIVRTLALLKETILSCCPESLERDYALRQLEGLTAETPLMSAIEVIRFGISSAACSAIACNENESETPIVKNSVDR
jgi:hypothetical protein